MKSKIVNIGFRQILRKTGTPHILHVQLIKAAVPVGGATSSTSSIAGGSSGISSGIGSSGSSNALERLFCKLFKNYFEFQTKIIYLKLAQPSK
jgi:hypothetical protein